MAHANVDLSWLAGLLTKTPTAGNSLNPDYNQEDSIPYVDPVTGHTSGVMPNNTPYTPPSQWQRLVHPEQANVIDSLNNQAVSKPLSASLSNASEIGVRAGNYSRLPHVLQAPELSPTEAAVAGYGDFSPPTVVNQQNRALMQASAGVPEVQAATDITQAGTGLKAALGEAGRQDVQESILDQDTLNHWFTAFHLTPMQSQLAEKQLKAETGVQPLVAQIRERALHNQQQQEEHLIPAQTQLSLTQTANSQNIASETGRLWPYEKATLDNHAIADAATSKYIPLQEPRSASIDAPSGTITPFQRNPLGASQYESMMSMMNDINGKGTQTITGPDGKRMTIKTPNNTHAPFSVLGTSPEHLPPAGSPLLSSSSNGPSVTPDPSGSMSPPTVSEALSHTTLNNSTPDGSAAMGGVGNYEKDMAGKQLQQLLKKYSVDPSNFDYNSSGPLGNIDTDSLTDFMSKNISKMSKEDRKTALSLMHKIQ